MVPRHWKVCRKTFFKLDRHQKPSKLANNGRYKNGPARRHPKGSKRSLLKLQTVVTKTVPLAVRRHLKVRFYVFSMPSRPIETRQKTVPLAVPKFKTVVTKSRSSQKVDRQHTVPLAIHRSSSTTKTALQATDRLHDVVTH